ncbi:MAG: NAD(P)/FAD-dependent oxidoreductase [Proteobacteria bacterium]|nr:NAD(P)/FAD-dependent oxidoreductase [Pseudomonadota bacterium]
MTGSRGFDVAVIGGGPAGMMAAGTAAKNGANVLLVEKNKQPGRKLLLTGKGRCNITNAELDSKTFSEVFGKQGKFLYSALFSFNSQDTVDFFSALGLRTIVERGNRVFPADDEAKAVLDVLKGFILDTGVTLLTNAAVQSIAKEDGRINQITVDGRTIRAEKFILCTGGLSYPGTGSTGDGLKWAEELGHTVTPTRPALVHLNIRETWGNRLMDLNLKNVRISVYQDNKKVDERFGEAFFVHKGLSGPIVIDMSRELSHRLQKGPVRLEIDLKPALDFKRLDSRVLKDLQTNQNKIFRNSLDRLLPKTLAPVIIELSGIDPEKKCHSISKTERRKLVHTLKELEVNAYSTGGFEKAIITSGGVSLKEIDPNTMRSRLVENLYFAGEIIDLDGPTGGYNLQLCWSTGYLAGCQWTRSIR